MRSITVILLLALCTCTLVHASPPMEPFGAFAHGFHPQEVYSELSSRIEHGFQQQDVSTELSLGPSEVSRRPERYDRGDPLQLELGLPRAETEQDRLHTLGHLAGPSYPAAPYPAAHHPAVYYPAAPYPASPYSAAYHHPAANINLAAPSDPAAHPHPAISSYPPRHVDFRGSHVSTYPSYQGSHPAFEASSSRGQGPYRPWSEGVQDSQQLSPASQSPNRPSSSLEAPARFLSADPMQLKNSPRAYVLQNGKLQRLGNPIIVDGSFSELIKYPRNQEFLMLPPLQAYVESPWIDDILKSAFWYSEQQPNNRLAPLPDVGLERILSGDRDILPGGKPIYKVKMVEGDDRNTAVHREFFVKHHGSFRWDAVGESTGERVSTAGGGSEGRGEQKAFNAVTFWGTTDGGKGMVFLGMRKASNAPFRRFVTTTGAVKYILHNYHEARPYPNKLLIPAATTSERKTQGGR